MSPDERHILLTGIRTKPVQSIYNNVTAADMKTIPVFAILDLKGNIVAQMEIGNGWAATWTPDGQVIFSAMDLSVNRFNRNTQKITPIYKNPVRDAKSSPDVQHIAVAEGKNILILKADGTGKRQLRHQLRFLAD